MYNPTLVHNFLSRSAAIYPEKTALICGEERLTYQSLDKHSDHLAHFLITLGMKRQDRIVIFLDNSTEAVISMYGILKASCIFIVLSSFLKSKNLHYILHDSGASLLITHVEKADIVKEAVHDCHVKILWIGNSDKIPKNLSSHSYQWHSLFSDLNTIYTNNFHSHERECIDIDIAALIYTSGSTGEPKGVISPHQNMISAAQSITQYLENNHQDIIINVLPLSFDYGLYQIIMSVMFGGTVVIEKNFLYLHDILKRIENEKVTGFPIVPPIAAMIINIKNIDNYNLSSLRYLTNTGNVLYVEHIRKLRKLFPQVKIFSMYGLTECKRVSYLHPSEIDRRPRSVGKAIPNCEVFILNEEGHEVLPDETGELVVRGSNVMQGYWNDQELTSKIFRPGRFLNERLLYTGDLFKKDKEGFLYFIGRRDEIIKVSGWRVHPKEIEDIIYEIPGVIEVAVVGVEDKIYGQAIKAFIVATQDSNLDKKPIQRYCMNKLESIKVPKYIEFLSSLPKSPNGKIEKKVLKSMSSEKVGNSSLSSRNN